MSLQIEGQGWEWDAELVGGPFDVLILLGIISAETVIAAELAAGHAGFDDGQAVEIRQMIEHVLVGEVLGGQG